MPRRLIATLLTPLLALLVGTATGVASAHTFPALDVPSWATYASGRAHLVQVAQKGIAAARKRWWNAHDHWYNDRFNPDPRHPLATVWSIVGLFEAIDAVQIGYPSRSHRQAVRAFANGAERYWNGDLRPHGGWAPYPGDGGADNHVWFDDNGWWGHGFLDAYRATHSKRYLRDAVRASDFVDAAGWTDYGMWWESEHWHTSDEALAAAALLAADIYQETGNAKYLARARKYINWADQHIWDDSGQLYGSLTYANGAMIGAQLAICKRAHDQAACARADALGIHAMMWWGRDLNKGPQLDTILLRNMLLAGSYLNMPKFYAWAWHNAQRALDNAGTNGLWFNYWDGSAATEHPPQVSSPGMILTHGATVELFAWLAAVKPPLG